MKRITTFSTLAVLCLAFAACGPQSSRDPNQPVLLGYDPVALIEGQEIPGDEQYALTRGSYRYLFASAENQARFETDPDAYGIQGDGKTCLVQPKVASNPDIYSVHEKKIYVFATAQCIESFHADPDAYLN